MWICYTLELVALAVWIGGLIVIVAAVIPAVFNSFGMEAGGRFLTRMFDGYNRATVGAIAVLVVCSTARTWMAREQPTSWQSVTRVESFLLLSMILLAVAIIAVLGPHSVELQERAFAAKDEAVKNQAYDAFFRTHRIVRGLYLVNLGLGIALMAVRVRNWVGRS